MADRATLEAQLAEVRSQAAKRMGEEGVRRIDSLIEKLEQSGIDQRAPKPGDRIPTGPILLDAVGKEIRLGDVLGRGPVVLSFYRGEW